jgi:hypothetical protein
VRRAATERARARIVHAVDARAVPCLQVLRIAPLPRVVVVVADEEVPPHRCLLGGEWVERRYVVVVRALAAAALAVPRVATRLEHQDAASRFREPCGNRAAAGARADDDVFGLEVVGRHQNVFKNSINARLSASVSAVSSVWKLVPK